jgi:hypothetical protein
MKNTLLLLIVLLSTCVNAQTKKPISTKPSTKKPTKPEIDKLYEKYKDSEIITLFTPHGDIYGNVSTEINDNEKPVSVTIHGVSDNKPAIAEFISTTIKMKLKQGYKATKVPFGWEAWNYAELVEQGLGWGYKEEHSFQLLMRKGSMYFRVDAGCCAENEQGYLNEGYTWEIETGDTKRQGGKNATNFEF